MNATLASYVPPIKFAVVAAYHTHTAQGGNSFSDLDAQWVASYNLPLYLGASNGDFSELTPAQADPIAQAFGSFGTFLGGLGTVSSGSCSC